MLLSNVTAAILDCDVEAKKYIKKILAKYVKIFLNKATSIINKIDL